MSPIGMDNQSVFEIACGFEKFAGCIADVVTIITTRAMGVKAHKLRISPVQSIVDSFFCQGFVDSGF
jgi:hypothetical protein